MSFLKKIHHIAIICSDYERSKYFYTKVLGFKVLREVYRQERKSYKLDLALNDDYIIELFSFPDPPKRASRPESTGLRHLAFTVDDLDAAIIYFQGMQIPSETIRIDEFTGRRFTFIADPDGLPIELVRGVTPVNSGKFYAITLSKRLDIKEIQKYLRKFCLKIPLLKKRQSITFLYLYRNCFCRCINVPTRIQTRCI